MNAILLCSAGLYLEYSGAGLLVDALNAAWPPFYQLPETEAQKIILGEAPYGNVCGVLYTHLHPDHFDEGRTRAFLQKHPGAVSLLPRDGDPEKALLQAGPFTVESCRFEHTPIPYPSIRHNVLFITAGNTSVYITADAAPDCEKHRAVLRGRRASAAFWNAQYLSYPETRELMRETAERNFIYHLPADPHDGVRRKCERNFQRCAAELSGITPLLQYPSNMSF
jgi:L-ascorbate metabolism protein UlaG (beta-lactamase superfamily)